MTTQDYNNVFTALRRIQNISGEEFVNMCWPRHKNIMKLHLTRKFSQAGDNIITFWHMLDLEHQQAVNDLLTKLSK